MALIKKKKYEKTKKTLRNQKLNIIINKVYTYLLTNIKLKRRRRRKTCELVQSNFCFSAICGYKKKNIKIIIK